MLSWPPGARSRVSRANVLSTSAGPSKLASKLDRLVRDGRARVLEIKDPLAILPLSEVLSAGNATCRDVLVEALSAFPEDEATLNLAIIALVDPDGEVRPRALAELMRRQDPRVVAQYREAVRQGNDFILCRAAFGLGYLRASKAVPDLANALTARRNKWVEVPVRRNIAFYPQVFDGTTIVQLGTSRMVYRPQVGICPAWIGFGDDIDSTWQYRDVTVYRTEVLEDVRRAPGGVAERG